jgi:hypothetical protein
MDQLLKPKLLLSRDLLLKFRDDDSVIINFCFLVDVPQVVKRDFIISGQEELVLLGVDSHVDIGQPPIQVDKNNVVVEDEGVDDQEAEVDQEGKEVAYKATRGRFSVVPVQLEDVPVPILGCKVNDSDKDKVKDRANAIPSYEPAHHWWEAEDLLLTQVAAGDHEDEHQGVREAAEENHGHLLHHRPVGIVQFKFGGGHVEVDNRGVHELEDHILAKVVDHHPDPKH